MSLGGRKPREGNAYEICAHAACIAPEAEAHHALRLRTARSLADSRRRACPKSVIVEIFGAGVDYSDGCFMKLQFVLGQRLVGAWKGARGRPHSRRPAATSQSRVRCCESVAAGTRVVTSLPPDSSVIARLL